MLTYHYQNTSSSLIYTPPILEQHDSSSDGEEICAVEKTHRGYEAGTVPRDGSELSDYLP
jgi:hypothetical protein